jgi:arsenate reductase
MGTNVLILCTHNSARSVLGEGMLNHWAVRLGKDVKAFSAGSAPGGRINPFALESLATAGIDTAGYHSKSWDSFVGEATPRMRIVITVCDRAVAEQCPWFPGAPVKTNWGYPDPSDAAEPGKKWAFDSTRQAIGYRMLQLLALPFGTLSNEQLQAALAAIARD